MLILRMLAVANKLKKSRRRKAHAERKAVVGGSKIPLQRRPHDSLPLLRKIARLGTAAGLKSMLDRKLIEHAKKLPPGIARTTIIRSMGAAKTVNQLRGIVNHPVHCIPRKLRRNALFANKIAGTNKRKSPGSGGGYNRNKQSHLGC